MKEFIQRVSFTLRGAQTCDVRGRNQVRKFDVSGSVSFRSAEAFIVKNKQQNQKLAHVGPDLCARPRRQSRAS